MMSLTAIIRDSTINNFVTNVKGDNLNYVVCGRCDSKTDKWVLLSTNGDDIWKSSWTKQDIELLIAPKSINQFFTDLRLEIDDKKLRIKQDSSNLKLCSDEEKITWLLKLVPESSRSTELSSLLFHLCDQVNQLREVASEQSRNIQRNYDQLTSLDSHKKNVHGKVRQREGMSLVNPNSKKLKKQHGLIYDSQ